MLWHSFLVKQAGGAGRCDALAEGHSIRAHCSPNAAISTPNLSFCRLEVPAGVTHQLVRQYLLHFGYAGTLAAFDAAAGLLPGSDAMPAER